MSDIRDAAIRAAMREVFESGRKEAQDEPREADDAYRRALEALPLNMQRALALHWQGLTYRDVARRMRISPREALRLMTRGLSLLLFIKR